jgi:hypothetical protein
MSAAKLQTAIHKIASEDSQAIRLGLEELRGQLASLDDRQLNEALSALMTVFYIDTFEHPELQELVDQAERVMVLAGTRVVPLVLERITDTDIKCQFHLARVLAQLGPEVIDAVVEYHDHCTDPVDRAFAIYAISNINNEQIKRIIPQALRDLTSDHKELRDTAARALGKIADTVPAEQIELQTRSTLFELLMAKLSDPYAGVRAKAARSIGKLRRRDYLDDRQSQRARSALRALAGLDEQHAWDSAFIVRREAENALRQDGDA